MFSQYDSTEYLTFTLKGPSGQRKSVTSMGVDEASPDNKAFLELVVQGNNLPAWVDAGCKFPSQTQCVCSGPDASRPIDGRRYKTNVAQTGTWPAAASGGSFTVDSKAALTPWMVG